jgi:flagellar hook-associated protein 3 FlgL
MIIRSTWSSRLSYLTQQTNRIGGELAEVNERIATGVAVSRPSDAPELTARIMSVEREISDQARYGDDAEYASNLHSMADTTLMDLSDVVAEARALAVQMGSETYSDQDRIEASAQVDGMIDQALSLLNTQVGDRYLYGGEAYNIPPFAEDLSYQGAAGASTINVADDVEVTVGFSGDALGMGDVFSSLSSLRDALQAGDASQVQSSLDGLTGATDTISSAQAMLGIEQSTALDFASFSESMQLELQGQLSSLKDDDTFASLVRMSELQTQYDAAIALTSKSQMTNLFGRI